MAMRYLGRRLKLGYIATFCVALHGCLPNDEPQTGSQTNWLRSCLVDADCGANSCTCGVCTHACSNASSCADLPGATCVASDDPALVAQCDGNASSTGSLCLVRCNTASDCVGQQACVAGVCSASSAANAHVSIDLQSRFQVLTGLGATLAYAEPEVTQFANSSGLYSAMFSELGLDTLRLRNRYGYVGDDNLSTAAAIIGAATESLGRRPAVVLASWSPPASFKANGSTTCNGELDTCTLSRLATGGFNYEAYADYWRDSLTAYAAVGVNPDFVAIQNNPDFVPKGIVPGEGCRFLPVQGMLTVTTNGKERTLEFPGFDQAIKAVSSRLRELQSSPKIIAPEASEPNLVSDYVSHLDPSTFDAIGHHLYGAVPSSPDLAEFRQLSDIGQSTGRPIFQTEMAADGLGTAVVLHHTLVTEGATAYLQNALVGPNAETGALVVLGGGSSILLEPAYHALRHYARFTDPGWVRAGASADSGSVLASSWVSPSGAVTVVVVNQNADALNVEIDTNTSAGDKSNVVRTSFDGVERSVSLGALPADHVVRLPGHSIVTVAFNQ